MKNILHFPPRLQPLNTLYPPVHPDLLLSINQTLTKYCRTHPGAPGLNTLSKTANSANTASTLILHALTRL